MNRIIVWYAFGAALLTAGLWRGNSKAADLYSFDFMTDPMLTQDNGVSGTSMADREAWRAGALLDPNNPAPYVQWQSGTSDVLIHTEGSGAGEEGLAFLIRRDAGPGLTGNEGISLEYGTTYKLSVTLSFDAINLNDNGGFQVYSFGGTSGSGNNANLDNHGWENGIVPPVIVTGTGYAGIGGTTADPGFEGVPGTPEGSLFLTADVVSQTYQVTGITLQNDAEQDGIVFQAFAGRGGNLTLESVTLEVETSVTDGDFDGDGDVDGIDFLFWQRGESLGGGTQAELALWELNYGASSSSAAVATAPEPSTAVAFSLAILITSIGSRGRRQR